jgi:hypothetical protein
MSNAKTTSTASSKTSQVEKSRSESSTKKQGPRAKTGLKAGISHVGLYNVL